MDFFDQLPFFMISSFYQSGHIDFFINRYILGSADFISQFTIDFLISFRIFLSDSSNYQSAHINFRSVALFFISQFT